MAKHACECCGYRTLDNPPGGTYQICPVCFWEDAPAWVDEWRARSGSNTVELWEAQRNFRALGAAERIYLEAVRPPAADEGRSPDWKSIDEMIEPERTRIRGVIETAFAGVSREDGVSLRETEVIDDYGSEEQRRAARALDTDRSWQEVSHRDLDTYNGVSFFDAIGWRYHLPAYMCWWLETGCDGSFAADCWLWSLDCPGHEHYADRYELLTDEQRRAVANFLAFVAQYSHDLFERQDAGRTLDRFWRRWLE